MGKRKENLFSDLNSQPEATQIEDLIEEDEEILWRGNPKKSAYILGAIIRMLPIVLIWLIFDGAFIYLICRFAASLGKMIWLLIAFFILHLTPVWIWLANIIKSSLQHKNIQYAITTKKIIIRSGIIGIDFKTIYYLEIGGIKCRVNWIDKLLKVGDIYISGSHQSVILHDLSKPYEIASRLNQMVVDIQTDMHYPNDLRPSENKGYRTKYRK